MRIETLALERIGPFESLSLEFDQTKVKDKAELHLFTGENGSGKSTVLTALASIFGQPPYPVIPRLWDRGARFTVKTSMGKIELEPNGSGGLTHSMFATLSQSFRSFSEGLRGLNYFKSSAQPIDFAAFSYSGERSFSQTKIHAMRDVGESPFLNALAFESRPDLVQQWIANLRTKEALHRMNHREREGEQYAQTIRRIEDVVRQITGCDFGFAVEAEPLMVGVVFGGVAMGLDGLPDGLKSILSWVTDLFMRLDRIKWVDDLEPAKRNFILFLDEIDVHMHPRWQRRVLPAVQSLFPNAQIFVSTHSPFVVGSVSDAWVYRFELEGNRAVLAKKERTSKGQSYSLVLDEIFGLDERFDMETERRLDEFDTLKDAWLKDPANEEALLKMAGELAGLSLELRDLIGRELMQLSRISGRELHL